MNDPIGDRLPPIPAPAVPEKSIFPEPDLPAPPVLHPSKVDPKTAPLSRGRKDMPYSGDLKAAKKRMRQNAPAAKSFSAYSWKKFRWNDLNRIPPIEIDAKGYGVRPHCIGLPRLKTLTEVERQVRFLVFYNYSGGNITLSCADAGVSRESYRKWMNDEVFRQRIKEAHDEIGDRVHYRLMMAMGVVEQPPGVTFHIPLLQAYLRKFRPDLFEGPEEDEPDAGRGQPQARLNVPRPAGSAA